MSTLQLLICALLIGVSAFMSASEVAVFSLSRFQLRSIKEQFRSRHRRIKKLLADPGGLLVTILVVNEMVNIALSAIVAGAVSRRSVRIDGLPPWAAETLLGLLITAPLVLLACEITPKVVGARANRLVATLAVGPLGAIHELMGPVRSALRRVVLTVSRRASESHAAGEKPASEALLNESDFMLMVEEGRRQGAVHEGEVELIRNVFEFDDRKVDGNFTPLAQVQSVPATLPLKAALSALKGQRFSRVPVLSPSRREVVGVLYSKDLLRAKLQPGLSSLTVASIMRKPLFVGRTMRLNALFRKMKQLKTHMAIVSSESGEALGVVTMSDVLDALFEDVFDADGEPLRADGG